MNKIKWIALDWGTSTLRAYALDKDDNIIDEKKSSKGMSSLKKDEYEDVLLLLIEPWLIANKRTTILACGMVGAKQGWMEAVYKRIPCSLTSIDEIISVETNDPRLDVYILPGISQEEPFDVMRGEETQILGFLEKYGDIDNFCLPGTHTKWVNLNKKEVKSFSTYMTGETLEIMSEHSILRFDVNKNNWHEEDFLSSITQSMKKPEKLLNNCFKLRAEGLIQDQKMDVYSSLLGLLLGIELLSTKKYWENKKIVLIGDSILAKRYELALLKLGSKPILYNSKDLTILGIKRIYKNFKEK